MAVKKPEISPGLGVLPQGGQVPTPEYRVGISKEPSNKSKEIIFFRRWLVFFLIPTRYFFKNMSGFAFSFPFFSPSHFFAGVGTWPPWGSYPPGEDPPAPLWRRACENSRSLEEIKFLAKGGSGGGESDGPLTPLNPFFPPPSIPQNQ